MFIFNITVFCYVQIIIWPHHLNRDICIFTNNNKIRMNFRTMQQLNFLQAKWSILFLLIKEVNFGRIREPNCSRVLFYHFNQLIFVFTVVQKLLPVVTLWYIWFKTYIVELSSRSTLFMSRPILNTVYLKLVINKPQQFHSYIIMWEYEPDQCRNPFFKSFWVLRILLKAYRQ